METPQIKDWHAHVYFDPATRDAAWEKLMKDDRMMAVDMPFDGKRMIFGGFEVVLEL